MDDKISSVIWTVHEESYSDGRTLGILANFDLDKNMERIDSFVYFFRMTETGGMYVFFETIVDMNDYLLYGDKKVKRAYMKEEVFDELYDKMQLDCKFSDHLKWQ